jgi:Na+/citrate or Na+/malate symporter
MIGIPVMAGGMGAGAVPLSQIYSSHTGAEPASILAVMVPAVALANAISIIFGGMLDTLGKKIPSLTGNGQLMKGVDNSAASGKEGPSLALNVKNLGVGLFLSVSFFCVGAIIGRLIPAIHAYAWMIIMVAVAKVACLIPEKIEACCFQWFQFMMTNLTTTLLVGIGITFTNLNDVVAALTPIYLFLVFITVVGAMIGAALVGMLVRFYVIEAIITAGLCMTNMGGTGDVATLSAAKRMELMPFSQISSRIGGAIMLLVASVMLGIFNFGG